MCGRYVAPSEAEMERYAHFGGPRSNPNPFPKTYNAAPTQRLPISRLVDDAPVLSLARWGLIPSWAKDASIGSRLINARAETVATKPAFRAAYKSRRCLVPALGFYEWQATPRGKVPHFITSADEGLMSFAGLWEQWQPPEGQPVISYTIITTDANEFMAKLHNRMPVILEPETWRAWLTTPDPAPLLAPCSPDRLRAWPVSTRVNSPKNNDAQLIEPAPA